MQSRDWQQFMMICAEFIPITSAIKVPYTHLMQLGFLVLIPLSPFTSIDCWYCAKHSRWSLRMFFFSDLPLWGSLSLVFYVRSVYISISYTLSHSLHVTGINSHSWCLHSSVGRASHRYRGGHGFKSRWSLQNIFCAFFATASVAS